MATVPLKKMSEEQVWSKRLSILVVGKTGTGKSTLIEGLFGQKVERGVLKDMASSITECNIDNNGVPLRILFWSPGAYDGVFSQDEQTKKMKELMKQMDLFIYTIRMDDTRMRPDDAQTIHRLSKMFGSSLWRKGMVVLTFANRVSYLDSHHTMRRSKEHLLKRAKQWEGHIHDILTKEGIVVKDIPIVPAGHHTEPQLFAGEESWMKRTLGAVRIKFH